MIGCSLQFYFDFVVATNASVPVHPGEEGRCRVVRSSESLLVAGALQVIGRHQPDGLSAAEASSPVPRHLVLGHASHVGGDTRRSLSIRMIMG